MRKTSQHKAYDMIKKLISDQVLKPGQHIAEQSIADMISIKRGPVRESLIQLHCEGILTRLPHAGFVVRQFQFKDVRDLYELREAVESSAAALAAARWNPDQLKSIREYYAMMAATYDQTPFNTKKIGYSDEMFHRSILKTSHNHAFERIFASLQFYSICLCTNISFPEHYSPLSEEIMSEHRAILEAIEKRDAEAARRSMQEHIRRARTSILGKIKEEEATILSNIMGEE